ncbi:MAG: carboxypeptidase regulatory-like domain-containing protein, partial [Methanothrix sp.]|nr:carboxypeptidase regulatory-like domain-containing protein [Methanothrix sp.]
MATILPALAGENSVTYCSNIPEATVNWNINHVLPQFNTTLGILNKVEFISNLTGNQHYYFENTGDGAGDAIVNLTMWSYVDMPYSRYFMVTNRNYTTTSVTGYDGILDYWGTSGFNFTCYNNSSTSSTMVYTAPTYDLSYFYATTPGQTRNYLTHARGQKLEDVPGTCDSKIATRVASKLCVKYDYTETTCISGYKLNEKGQGLFGWTIYIDDNGNSQLDLGEVNTTTNATGYWRICGLLPGDYTVCEVLITGWSKLSPAGCHDITIDDPPLPISNINFTNVKLACLSGFKLDGCPPYSGLSGWTIWANDTLGNNTSTVTDGAGYWEICNLRNETYTVCEVPKDGWVQTSLPSCHTKILAGTNITNINFTNQRLRNISGYKLDDCDNTGLPGWTITLSNSSGEVDTTTTNATGYYEFSGLDPGSYTVTETTKPGWTTITTPVLPVTLDCTNLTNQNFTNIKELCISGYKLDDCDNTGLPGWTITLSNSSGE